MNYTVKNTQIDSYYAPSDVLDSPYVVKWYQALYDNNTGLMVASKPMSARFDDNDACDSFMETLKAGAEFVR